MLTCPECGAIAILRDTTERYGRSYGMEWVCPVHEEVFVGCHGDSDRPKGTLAGPETRDLRKECHSRFDALWRGKHHIRRRQCYAALAEALGIAEAEAHIGMMDADQCKQVLVAMPQIEAAQEAAGEALGPEGG